MGLDKDKSILLSQICLFIFAVILLLMDIFMFPVTRWYFGTRFPGDTVYYIIVTVLYICTVIGWIFLIFMWRLLANVKRGEVFVTENVKLMRIISWLCVLVAVVCAVSGAFYHALLFVAVAAAFVALIVRIVKNCFQQAIAMKDELDLTV
ncbi:MAG: DUF2975 domain-containing protein [Lachnospiraceae bacterium]|nr:DUF2975 domain-containing protein [Lachnospiraceae bacterium]